MISLILLTLTGLVLLFLGLTGNKKLFSPVGISGLLLSLVFLVINLKPAFIPFSSMLNFDAYATAFALSMTILTICIFLLGMEYYEAMEKDVAENYALLLFSLVGAIVMVSFNNLVMLFLGVEILSIPLYILSGGKKKSYRSNEASFKYFLLGSFASAFLLFGIALLYGVTASFDLQQIKASLTQSGIFLPHPPALYVSGVLMIFVGMGFKVAAAPFHFWSPDVYEGSPTLITAFMATVVKTAGFAALWRLLDQCLFPLPDSILWTVWILTFITLAVGNLSALWQSSFKRLLAYSSIANSGFLLLAILSAGQATPQTLLYYTFTYSLATLIAFSLLFSVKKASAGSEQIEIFHGLWKQKPFLAILLSLALFSLAGVPPLAGFFAKYLVFFQAIQEDFLWISFFAIVMAVVGIYYYFSVLRFIFSGKGEPKSIPFPVTSLIVLIICSLLLLLLGIFPSFFTLK